MQKIDMKYFKRYILDYEEYLVEDLEQSPKMAGEKRSFLMALTKNIVKEKISEEELLKYLEENYKITSKRKKTIIARYLDFLCIYEDAEIFRIQRQSPKKEKMYYLMKKEGSEIIGEYTMEELMKMFKIKTKGRFIQKYHAGVQVAFGDYEVMSCEE